MRQFQNLKTNRNAVLSISLVVFFLVAGTSLFPVLNSNAFSLSIVNAPERIVAHPNPASPGSALNIVGYNFPIAQTIFLKFDSTSIGTTTAGPTGQFKFQYTVPATTTDGSHTIYATDSFGDVLFTTLIVQAGITLTPIKAIDGGSVTISGSGFSHSSTITITFDSKTIKTLVSSSTGSFSLAYTVPQTTLAGTHTFAAKDSGHTASKTFTTISKITLSRTMGSVGATVKVKGSGFAANLPVTLTFNGLPIPGQLPIKTNSTGGFSPSFSVPNYPAGTYVVKATDSKGDTSSSKFTIA